jgi:hypothetical protein
MIKLSDLLELQIQPGEAEKMKNFLYRGSRDQIAQADKRKTIMEPYNDEGSTTYARMKGTIEGVEPLTTDHPENKEKVVGWNWKQDNTIDGDNNIETAISGREIQTLQDLKKMIKRLLDSGFTMSEIENGINTYVRG